MASKKRRKIFDEAYYERFYHDDRSRVTTEDGARRLCEFVCAYLRHLDVEVVDGAVRKTVLAAPEPPLVFGVSKRARVVVGATAPTDDTPLTIKVVS